MSTLGKMFKDVDVDNEKMDDVSDADLEAFDKFFGINAESSECPSDDDE